MTIRRTEGNVDKNYHMMISKEPMQPFKLKICITGICPTDRYLDMGLTTETQKNNTSGSLINSFGSVGNYSYCGYSKSNMDGSMLASSSNSGFEIGTEVYMDFDGSKLDIYTQDRRANLTKNLPEGSYYLFFVLYHEQASCTITKYK